MVGLVTHLMIMTLANRNALCDPSVKNDFIQWCHSLSMDAFHVLAFVDDYIAFFPFLNGIEYLFGKTCTVVRTAIKITKTKHGK